MKKSPIGIFDSGIGGLTVAHAIKEKLPNESIIYFGDTEHLPYGEKSKSAIQGFSTEISKFLLKQKCKIMLNKYNFSLPNVIFFLVISLPMVSIFGSFLADFFLSLSSLLFLIHCLIKKNYKYFKNIFFIIFLIWYFYLVVLSLTSKYPLLSLQSSLFYIRFGVFVLCVYYLILNYKEFLKFFCLSLLITFVFLTLNSFFQYFFTLIF